MSPNDGKDKIIADWFSKSANDLESAQVLYDNKLYANCLYHLQQSNEKLVKALLLSIGILTPRKAKTDWAIKSALGFLPKEPSSYRHRTLPSLLSDLEKSVPSIEKAVLLLKNSELGPRVTGFLETIRMSKKGVQKLKKKPFGLIQTPEQLEIEIKAAQTILDCVDQATNNVKEELEKLDSAATVQLATSLVRKAGFRVDASQTPSFEEIKSTMVPLFRLIMLAMLSAALASFLDPLESATRYPDSQHASFDENNPYIKNFIELHDIIASILQKSLSSQSR